MSYQILANKWRPKTFKEVIGQDYIITALINSLLLNRIHQSYLFSGSRGIGKTTIARILAKSLICEKKISPSPCRICENCKNIETGKCFDFIEVDAASRTKIEDIRELLEDVQYFPSTARFKIYLIDEVHMLSKYSFNALLKILEETPSYIKFIFATTDPQRLPITILSRCLQFHLKLLNNNLIYQHLKNIIKKENIISESEALQLIANASNGSMRDAFTLTDQAIVIGKGKIITHFVNIMLGNIDDNHSFHLVEAIAKKNFQKVMLLLDKIISLGIEEENLIISILRLLHRIAMLKYTNNINQKNIQQLKILSNILSMNEIHQYYKIFLQGRKDLQFFPDRRIAIEMILLQILFPNI